MSPLSTFTLDNCLSYSAPILKNALKSLEYLSSLSPAQGTSEGKSCRGRYF